MLFLPESEIALEDISIVLKGPGDQLNVPSTVRQSCDHLNIKKKEDKEKEKRKYDLLEQGKFLKAMNL